MIRLKWAAVFIGLGVAFVVGWLMNPSHTPELQAQESASKIKGWTPGKGWGPWGKDDEVGSLNAMTLQSVKAALALVKQGKVYDLGAAYDAESY